jgi:hypothetical protein
MKRAWCTTVKILTGLLLTAFVALPQAYTISAKPGVLNYIEGNVSINGRPVAATDLRTLVLNPGDVLSTEIGKAEVLLTPGVFLRMGDNTRLRMISPSLVDTQLALESGQAMLEVDELVKDNRISILNHGASISIEKSGLYRFAADDPPVLAVLDGKAQVYFGEKKISLGKGRQTILSEELKVDKFDRKKEDELYAWSNVRSEYNASVSYQSAQAAYAANPSVGGLGYGPGYGPGWFWNSGLSSWAWMPGDAAFFSPFGWGFFSPGWVGYAPVVAVPVGRGNWRGRDRDRNGNRTPPPGGWHHNRPGGGTATASNGVAPAGANSLVPVNPNHPPGMSFASSPWADHAARVQAARSAAMQGGFRNNAGRPIQSFGNGGSAPSWSGHAAGSSGTGSRPGWSGGSHTGGSPGGGGFRGGGGGGGHSGGGGGGSRSR